jgi:hypothetical protein
VNAILGVDAPPLPVRAALDPFRTTPTSFFLDFLRQNGKPVTGQAAAPDPYVWQRLPLVEEDVWVATLPWLPDQTRQLVMGQLWRRYQIPTHLHRLLPLLDLARVDHKGERLEMFVEAFTFRKCVTRVDRTKRDKAKAVDEAKKARQALVDSLTEVTGEIERLKKVRRALADPPSDEVLAAVSATIGDNFERVKEALTPKLPAYTVLEPLQIDTQSEIAIDKAVEQVARLGRAWLRQVDPDAFKGELDSDEVSARLAKIDEVLAVHEKRREELTEALNPIRAKEQALAAFEAEITLRREATGRTSAADRRKQEELVAEIARMKEEEKKEGTREEAQRWEEVTYFQNMGRQRVPFRIVDAELGLFDVLTPGPPVWLANPGVSDLAQTFVLPMPVRITFGTKNAKPVMLQTGDPRRNIYVETTIETLKGLPDLAKFVGPVGDVLPTDVGEEQLRFTFTRDQIVNGATWVSDEALSVPVDARPPLRRLVALGGIDNREAQLERVRPLVRAILSRPDTLDGGSLTIKGPRPVVLSGRVSAVTVQMAADGNGFVTEVSFDANTAPLPGVEAPAELPQAIKLTFGIDVKATENA